MDLTISHRSEFLARVTKVAFIFAPADTAGVSPAEGFGVMGAPVATGFADATGTCDAPVFVNCPFRSPGFSPPSSSTLGPSVDPGQLEPPVEVIIGGRGIEDDEMKYRIIIP